MTNLDQGLAKNLNALLILWTKDNRRGKSDLIIYL
jgi:hypothetical protein